MTGVSRDVGIDARRMLHAPLDVGVFPLEDVQHGPARTGEPSDTAAR
jgi:hypothetical protein